MKTTIFLVVTSCSLEGALRFGESYRFRLQGRRVTQARKQQKKKTSCACKIYQFRIQYIIKLYSDAVSLPCIKTHLIDETHH
jgi:hypothetical protein